MLRERPCVRMGGGGANTSPARARCKTMPRGLASSARNCAQLASTGLRVRKRHGLRARITRRVEREAFASVAVLAQTVPTVAAADVRLLAAAAHRASHNFGSRRSLQTAGSLSRAGTAPTCPSRHGARASSARGHATAAPRRTAPGAPRRVFRHFVASCRGAQEPSLA